VVRSTIELGHTLGLSVIAEGVEDVITRELLSDLGCDRVQGFLSGRPVPAQEIVRWWRDQDGRSHPESLAA
jgi:EAL domain-containing protein (putative c-di-GMP-specific phosphodiesterase class I)